MVVSEPDRRQWSVGVLGAVQTGLLLGTQNSILVLSCFHV